MTRVLASTTSPDVFLGCFYAVFVALTPSRSVFPWVVTEWADKNVKRAFVTVGIG
jgi:hypothetical protein